MKLWGLVVVLVIIVIMMALCGGGAFIAQIPFLLALGWLAFLIKTLPQMTTEPLALVVGGAALAGMTGLAHWLLGWGFRQIRPSETPPRH